VHCRVLHAGGRGQVGRPGSPPGAGDGPCQARRPAGHRVRPEKGVPQGGEDILRGRDERPGATGERGGTGNPRDRYMCILASWSSTCEDAANDGGITMPRDATDRALLQKGLEPIGTDPVEDPRIPEGFVPGTGAAGEIPPAAPDRTQRTEAGNILGPASPLRRDFHRPPAPDQGGVAPVPPVPVPPVPVPVPPPVPVPLVAPVPPPVPVAPAPPVPVPVPPAPPVPVPVAPAPPAPAPAPPPASRVSPQPATTRSPRTIAASAARIDFIGTARLSFLK